MHAAAGKRFYDNKASVRKMREVTNGVCRAFGVEPALNFENEGRSITYSEWQQKKNGRPMNLQSPYGWLKEFCKEHDFPFYGIHQFRHLHTSLLIGAGIDPTTVSGVLGHAQVSTTLNLYSHMFRPLSAASCKMRKTPKMRSSCNSGV